MRIAVLAPGPVPPTFGGTERAVAGLVREINARGEHEAELLAPAVDERTFASLLEGYRVFTALDVGGYDRVISVKYPAWAADHPHHTAYVFHPLRGVYDTYDVFRLPRTAAPRDPALAAVARRAEELWNAALRVPGRRADLTAARDELLAVTGDALAGVDPDDPEVALPSPLARVVVRALDAVALAPGAIQRHLALSQTVANRADYFPPGIRPGVVYLPPDLPGIHQGERRHLFTASRLDDTKRVALLVEAMRYTDADIPLLIAGRGPDAEHLEWLAGDDERIRFLGFVSDDDLADLYADALAVPFVPLDEDYGLITVEAMASGTPVITSTDAGGPTELVDHWVNGIVAAPTPSSLAGAFDVLAANPEIAERFGSAAQVGVADLTWGATIEQLLGTRPARSPRPLPFHADVPTHRRLAATGALTDARRAGYPLVVVLSTYPVHPASFGGPLRCSRLLAGAAAHHDVHLVCLGPLDEPKRDEVIEPGIRQTVVPLTRAHAEATWLREHDIRVPLGDICGGLDIGLTPDFLAVAGASLREAAAVVLEHPYLLPALDLLGSRAPLILDDHNVEWDLKLEAYPDTVEGRRLAAAAGELERRATLEADAVVTVSDADARRLADLTGRAMSDIVVVPNGADLHHIVPTAASRAASRDRWLARFFASTATSPDRVPTRLALFMGSWHPPNLDAARVAFAAARALPDVLFLHGGSHALALRGRPVPPNVVLLGPISDRVRDTLLATVDVALNPMRQGSGTNLKLLEYFAAGVPIVSTAFGSRGLVEDGDRFVHPTEPEHLAETISRVLADPAQAQALAQAGRAYVEAHYAWDDLSRAFGAVVEQVVAGARVSS